MKKVKELFQLFKHYRKEQIYLCVLMIVNVLLTAYLPFLLSKLINYIVGKNEWELILQTGLVILYITLINLVLNVYRNYRWHRLRLHSVNYLRMRMFESALLKPVEFFQKNSIGSILARVMDDVNIAAQQASIGIPMLFSNIMQVIVVGAVLFMLDIRLALIVVLSIPVYYFGFNYLNKFIRETSQQERIHYSNVMKDAQEKLLGVRTIKIYQKESYMVHRFKEVLDNYFKYIRKTLYYQNAGGALTNILMSVLPIIVLVYGSSLVFRNLLSIGTLIAFYTYLSRLYEPVRNLSDFNLGLQTTLGMCERVLGFLKETDHMDEGNIAIDHFASIEVKDLNFAYAGQKTVLADINFKIEKGDRVAIIGESGSGKTTLLNLIMKFYTSNEGQILVNGIDIREISKKSLYEHITLLEQNLFLFDGTLKDNITFGDELDNGLVQQVVEVTNLKSVLTSSGKGLDTPVSELGSNLSGGEKQRLCLSRALIRRAGLVLLDEATSSLDARIENEIVTNLEQFLGEKTLIAVSHRPRILSICNKVIHIEHGRVAGFYEINDASDFEKVHQLVARTA